MTVLWLFLKTAAAFSLVIFVLATFIFMGAYWREIINWPRDIYADAMRFRARKRHPSKANR